MNATPKVVGATGGSLIGGALSVVLLWGVGAAFPSITIPPEVAGAVTILVSAAATFVAGYFAPHSPTPNPPGDKP